MEKKSKPFFKSVLLALISSVGITALGFLAGFPSCFMLHYHFGHHIATQGADQ